MAECIVLVVILLPRLSLRFARVKDKLCLVEMRVNWPCWSKRKDD